MRDLVLNAQNGKQANTVVLKEAESELVISNAQEAGDWLERHAVPSEHASVPPNFMFLPSQNQVTKDAFFEHLVQSNQHGWGLGHLDEGFV
ncbi:hypothetical protein WDU99_16300, partial [Microbacterium sp. Mu-80]